MQVVRTLPPSVKSESTTEAKTETTTECWRSDDTNPRPRCHPMPTPDRLRANASHTLTSRTSLAAKRPTIPLTVTKASQSRQPIPATLACA